MKKLAIALTALCLPLSAFAGEMLSGDQIKQTFSGKTVHWEHMKKAKSGKTHLGTDGSVVGIENGKKRTGSWEVKGDQWCMSWGRCLAVESDNGIYYKVKGGSKRVTKITKIEDGNTVSE